MNKQSTSNRSTFSSNSKSNFSPSLHGYFTNLLRDASYSSSYSSSFLLLPNSSPGDITNREKSVIQTSSLSCNSFEILPDDAKTHLNKHTVENLCARMKKISSSTRLDRWDCDEQNQIQIQQAKTSIYIPSTQQQQRAQKLDIPEEVMDAKKWNTPQLELQKNSTISSPVSSNKTFQKPTRLPSLLLEKGENIKIVDGKASTMTMTYSTDVDTESIMKIDHLSSSSYMSPPPSPSSVRIMDVPKQKPSKNKDEMRLIKYEAMLSTKQYNSDSVICCRPLRKKSSLKFLKSPSLTTSPFETSESSDSARFKAPTRLPSLILDKDDYELFRQKKREASKGEIVTPYPSRWGERDAQVSKCKQDYEDLIDGEDGLEDEWNGVYAPIVSSPSKLYTYQEYTTHHQQPDIPGNSPSRHRRTLGQESNISSNINLVCPKRRRSFEGHL